MKDRWPRGCDAQADRWWCVKKWHVTDQQDGRAQTDWKNTKVERGQAGGEG